MSDRLPQRSLTDEEIEQTPSASSAIEAPSIPIDNSMILNAKEAEKVGMDRITISVPIRDILYAPINGRVSAVPEIESQDAKDAARYRYIRQHQHLLVLVVKNWFHGEALDAAIDAAIRAEGGETS